MYFTKLMALAGASFLIGVFTTMLTIDAKPSCLEDQFYYKGSCYRFIDDSIPARPAQLKVKEPSGRMATPQQAQTMVQSTGNHIQMAEPVQRTGCLQQCK